MLAMALLTSAVYYSGLSGPFTLDDNSNLLGNKAIQINSLDSTSLKNAAFSIQSGPTHRPVSMLSFAINHYFAGSFNSTTPYKITNLAIHIGNGWLVFVLSLLLIRRSQSLMPDRDNSGLIKKSTILFSAFIAFAWSLHPIQLTSVLYVVQRMSALSGTFVLLSLITYLLGRTRIINEQRFGAIFVFALAPAMGIVGVFAKENAALLPLYISAIEATLFKDEKPWHLWNRLSKRTKLIILSLVTLAVVVACYWIIDITQSAYRQRSFSVGERVMTEARVLVFYISQILIPQISNFGLHHDDIAISRSLINPWTTLASVLCLTGILLLAFRYRSRLPLFSLGIFLFIAAHLLESTIYPLDIAYEHRNYFASFGILLAVGQLIILLGDRIDRRLVLVLAAAYIFLFASVTLLISRNWETDISLYTAEIRNHPDSAILNFEYAGLLEQYRKHDEAITFASRAISLNPDNIAFRIFLALLQSRNNMAIDEENTAITADLLKSGTITPTATLLLGRVMACIADECSSLISAAERWTAVLAVRKNHPRKLGQYNHMHGVVKYYQRDLLSAQNSILKAIEIYPGNIPAYIDLAAIYSQSNQTEKAIKIYRRLIQMDADQSSSYQHKIEALSIPRKK